MNINMIGNIAKMIVRQDAPVSYDLPIGDACVDMNAVIGKQISLKYTGEIHCVACGRLTKKSFNQGHCYPCFRSLASCDMCIMKPETCHFDQGTCREPEWAMNHCMQPHYVYLANSSGIKVGITRGSQVPTRWIDQGATQALPIFKVATRLQSGLLEVEIKNHVSDRTDWRKMLKGDAEPVDLEMLRDELTEKSARRIDELMEQYGDNAIEFLPDAEVTSIDYPVETYPEKIKSLNLDKQALIEGHLQGIKGQYLILDTGVLNIRKYSGYNIKLEIK
jgi:hypothetical protein